MVECSFRIKDNVDFARVVRDAENLFAKNYSVTLDLNNTAGLKSSDVETLLQNKNFKIIVRGGLDTDKQLKYATKKKYGRRVTFEPTQLIDIIRAMEGLGAGINPRWSDLAKALYIYKKLMMHIKYKKIDSVIDSGLFALINRAAVCAGYALIYKEMCDRAGIKCEYVRGNAGGNNHAWNVLTINGKSYPVDLTWDSIDFHKNPGAAAYSVQYFGTSRISAYSHKPDEGEYQYTEDVFQHGQLEAAEKEIGDVKVSKKFDLTKLNKMLAEKATIQNTNKGKYYVPRDPKDLELIVSILKDIGIMTQRHDSKLFGQTVLIDSR
ncbi:MAG: hypothetical protein FWG80_02065 [Alphaproteobacteria bacterium]|nr:hypothetical protein [Alphaproteobacteria bacterium]